MTRVLDAADVAQRISDAIPNSVVRHTQTDVWIEPEKILDVCRFLKEDERLDFAFLTAVTAVDYVEYFELIYHLLSMRRNHSTVVKAQLFGRDELSVSSVYSLWQGADLQEREIWDLMGIRFEGHPNMKRILLWEGYEGHPLRKDYLG